MQLELRLLLALRSSVAVLLVAACISVGLQRKYLKVSFNTVQELMSVKNELLLLAEKNRAKLESSQAYKSLFNNVGTKFAGKMQDYFEHIVEVREYDVPYHIRFAIDNSGPPSPKRLCVSALV